MAERRMFAKTIIDSDAFIEMPMSARLLYYDLGMRADDDGFVNSPKKIMRMIGASTDDMNILIMRKFIIPFDSGVVVIKHWRINNYLRNDRYTETQYIEEKGQLTVDEKGNYHLGIPHGIPHGIPTVSTGKDSIGKNSINNIHGEKEISCDEFFDSIWKLYPKKLGKSAVKKTQRKTLMKLGYDSLKKCIDNYKDYVSSHGIQEQYVMYGSTFFNGRYVDFMDEDVVTEEVMEVGDGRE